MQNVLQYVVAQFKAIWSRLDFTQRMTTVLLTLIMIIGLGVLATWSARPDYQVLFANLEPQDAGNIVTKLNEAAIPYELSAGGSVISVPSKYIHETRLSLASEGLPKVSGSGFELFDDFKFGVTDFTQRLNFQRALETELSRTISQLASVRQARVHLAFPDEEIYTDLKQPTTASVILSLLGSAHLSTGQVNGIVHLVSSAVKGLHPDNVTVVDTHGTMLYHREASEEGFGFSGSQTQLQAQKSYELQMESRIQSMLRKVLGPNKSVVRVSALLDFDMEKTDSEIFEQSDAPIPRSTKLTEESFAGEGEGAQAPNGAIPTNGQKSNYSKLEETSNFEVTKHLRRRVKAPGSVKKISVAIVLDREVPEEEKANIEATVKAATGFDDTRGDVVVVQTMEFDKSVLAEAAEDMKKAQTMAWAKSGGKGLLAVGGAVFLLLFVRSTLKKASEFELPEGLQMNLSTAGMQAAAGGSEDDDMENKLRALATQQTDEFIQVLRGWLNS